MPARNPGVNVVLEKPLYEAVDHLAKVEGVSRTQADIARRSAITERQLRSKIIEAEGARHEGPIASLMP